MPVCLSLPLPQFTAGAQPQGAVGIRRSRDGATKGRVTLSAKFIPEGRLLEVTVKDTGRGLSEEGLARLFKPCVPPLAGPGRSMHLVFFASAPNCGRAEIPPD